MNWSDELEKIKKPKQSVKKRGMRYRDQDGQIVFTNNDKFIDEHKLKKVQ